MKLQAQYNKISLVSSIIVLLIAGAGYYFFLRHKLLDQQDETLRVEQVEILDYVKTNHTLPPAKTYHDQRIEFKKTNRPFPQLFRTLTLTRGDDKELSRQLVFTLEVNGDYYIATVTKSLEATEKIIAIILLITMGLIIILSILLFLANRFFVKRLWKPFQLTLGAIKKFDLNAPSSIKTQKTQIEEFNQLNENIALMTDKVVKDYLSLKHFTDQASHEMQTPLAVVISKLDILIQNPALSEKNLQDLQAIYDSVDKMSKLGQSLLMLTKIENNQFPEREELDIRELTEEIINELEEWIRIKTLVIDNGIKDLKINMSLQLANTLIGNLIINAIKHSEKEGRIFLGSDSNKFIISNEGNSPLDPQQIFNRFWKSESSDGTGLGLAVVKQICDHYGFPIEYSFKNQFHHFTITF